MGGKELHVTEILVVFDIQVDNAAISVAFFIFSRKCFVLKIKIIRKYE